MFEKLTSYLCIPLAAIMLMNCAGSKGDDAAAKQAVSLNGERDEVPPNIIVIFTDDQGYGDLGCYGSPKLSTPNIDRMAREGVRFTSFYAGQPVCSASRASLLTGCYPSRVSIQGALFPKSPIGLNPEETTIAELCKSKGYATGMMGKWHLGDYPQFLPTRQGFDEYRGIPYSNDMWPAHPENDRFNFDPLPFYENDSIVDYYTRDQNNLTTRLTEGAVAFIEAHKDNPFFLYVAHPLPHVPLYVSDKFRGKSAAGLYGDVMMEIDWSVGRILETLRNNGIDERTLVIYSSDNGPWLNYGSHAGSALPLREGKSTVLEGGVRVPCIMRWPGKIPAGTQQDEPAMNIDILPTVAALIDAPLPPRPIDGKNIWPLLIPVWKSTAYGATFSLPANTLFFAVASSLGSRFPPQYHGNHEMSPQVHYRHQKQQIKIISLFLPDTIALKLKT